MAQSISNINGLYKICTNMRYLRTVSLEEGLQNMEENLTAFCGLCCMDCIPSREEFFMLANRLDEMLGELQFEHYAELKAEITEEYKDYPKFLSILHHIKGLRCSRPCRTGGGKPLCNIRECVKDKGLNGCWECQTRPGCALLDRLRRIHPNLDYHLDLIKEMGPARWFEKRKEHYRWQVTYK